MSKVGKSTETESRLEAVEEGGLGERLGVTALPVTSFSLGSEHVLHSDSGDGRTTL